MEWLINKWVYIYCVNLCIKSFKFNKWYWFVFYGNGIGKKFWFFFDLEVYSEKFVYNFYFYIYWWFVWLKRVFCYVEISLSMYKGKYVFLFCVVKSLCLLKNWLNWI